MAPVRRVTVTLAKGVVGGWGGDLLVHPDLLDAASTSLASAQSAGTLTDYAVTHVGDALVAILAHTHAPDAAPIGVALRDAFGAAGRVAQERKLHAASVAPRLSVADLALEERPEETLVALMMEGAGAAALSLPLARAFADPFATRGLADDPRLAAGFAFEIRDLAEGKAETYVTPEHAPALVARLRDPARYALERIQARAGGAGDTVAAAVTTAREAADADPAALVRAGNGFPDVRDVVEPWAAPVVAQDARGRPVPVLPVGLDDAQAARRTARIVALGFTLARGELVGPVDLFDDPAFDAARASAARLADAL